MAFITLTEVFYLLILIAVVAYVFTGVFPIPRKRANLFYTKRFDWQEFKLAALVAAPGILFHELAHKFSAMLFGLNAQFFIWLPGTVIAIILKAISSPLILIAPGYVGISGDATPIQNILISFAGPLTNLIFWIGCIFLLKKKNLNRNLAIGIFITKEINKLLFIFNMIPIPPLDGSKVLFGLFSLLFG